jgi:hypothetical protein
VPPSIDGSSRLVTSTTSAMVSGWNKPVPGRPQPLSTGQARLARLSVAQSAASLAAQRTVPNQSRIAFLARHSYLPTQPVPEAFCTPEKEDFSRRGSSGCLKNIY